MRISSVKKSTPRTPKSAAERSGKAMLQVVTMACGLFTALLLAENGASGQVSVTTEHNDIGRTGQNLNETILTPKNVNVNQFGKLFFQPTNGAIVAQPLYVANVQIPGKGTHNVVYVATTSVYAYDADDDGGINGKALWQTVLTTAAPSVGSATIQSGVIGTPVIDPPSATDPSGTMYVVSTTGQGSTLQFLLHALDITTGAEKFAGPVVIKGSVPGTGTGSSSGTLAFDPTIEQQRPALLLLNGVVYIAFGSWADNGPWHGWVFSYNAVTLKQDDVFCLSPNGVGAGIWASGAGLVGEVNDPNKPFGRMFLATGNGSYNATKPYQGNTNKQNFSMSLLDLDLTNGVMTVEDLFTPHNQAELTGQDGDLGSGGPMLLPTQTLTSGKTITPILEIGKTGTVYVLDRDNLGGYNAGGSTDNVYEEFQTPSVPTETKNWGAGVWGAETYWNNHIYYGGETAGAGKSLGSYSFVNGVMSTTPTSQTSWLFFFPGPTPSISANGNTNGVLWLEHTDDYVAYHPHPQMMQAYDANNLQNLLYSTDMNFARDNPGVNVEYGIPTVANGKVYVGTNGGIAVYGLLNITPTVATPVLTPNGGSIKGSTTVQITDSTPGAQIYYTTDGSTPTPYSNLYTQPINVTSSETISAIASATGYLQGAPVSAVFTVTGNTANPTFSLAAGTYAGTQKLTISDSTPGAVIYYTTNGAAPTTASAVYGGPISVPVPETVQAFAVAPGLTQSATVSVAYTITPPYVINYTQGFSSADGPMQFNGSTNLDDTRLQLTNGGMSQAGSAFWAIPVNIQAFTTDFIFQLSNPVADGITFTIQNNGPAALGLSGDGLGYAGIGKSVAIKFDLHDNFGEGPNSTGMYVNGALPTTPAIDLTGTGIDLHSGDQIDAHITYDGTTLNLTLTDVLTLATRSFFLPINIPATVGGNTAYVGFTGGTGGGSSSQKIETWTYLPGPPPVPNYPDGFDAVGLIVNGNGALSGKSLQLTNGGLTQTTSVYYSTQLNIEAFTTSFDFQMTHAVANGFTFVMQNAGPAALGDAGYGNGLGYAGIPHSAAIKFDIHNSGGEGPDSTGFYTNGALPTVPAINLVPSGLILSNGDSYHVLVTYDGTILGWTISDNTHPNIHYVNNSVKVNLPSILGSNVAYVGFTAATGSTSAIQNILDWSYTNP